MANQYSTEEIEIRASIEQWADAMRNNKVDEVMAHYSEDIVAYDAVAQLQFLGKKAYEDHWLFCVTYAPYGMAFDFKDLVIHSEASLAFSYSLASCGCYDEKGNIQSSWMRVTRGYRKVNGKWLVIHEHFSSPFDMESGKALFDLQP